MKKTPPKIQKALTGYLDLKNIDIEKRKIFFCVCFTSFKTFIQIRQSLKLAKENNNRFKREKGQKLPGPQEGLKIRRRGHIQGVPTSYGFTYSTVPGLVRFSNSTKQYGLVRFFSNFFHLFHHFMISQLVIIKKALEGIAISYAIYIFIS